jgi:hypothetical protein
MIFIHLSLHILRYFPGVIKSLFYGTNKCILYVKLKFFCLQILQLLPVHSVECPSPLYNPRGLRGFHEKAVNSVRAIRVKYN